MVSAATAIVAVTPVVVTLAARVGEHESARVRERGNESFVGDIGSDDGGQVGGDGVDSSSAVSGT